MGTGAVGDVVVVPVGLVVVELDVVEATELVVVTELVEVTELVAVKSVDGTDIESSIEVLDSMLAVAERLDAAALAVFDVKVFTEDKVPDATLDAAEPVLAVTGAIVVIELPDATMMGAVADPVAAADDSALLR